MVINRQKINQNKSTSMKNKVEQMQKNNKDYMSELFPIVDGTSSRKYNAMKEEEAHLHNKLKKNDLVDFKVPAWICMQNAEALKSTKTKLRPQIMRALGIHSNSKEDKMTYEQFLNLNSLLKYRRQDTEDMIDFMVRLFDPTMQGFSSNDDFSATLDIMFEADTGDQKSPAKKDATKKKVE